MKLDKITNVAVIVAALFVIGTGIWDRFSARPSPAQASVQQLVGKTLPLPASMNTGDAAALVFFVSKNCHYCSDSMPFYRRLAELRDHGSKGFKLLALAPSGRETGADMQAYFAQNRIALDAAGEMQFAAIGVSGTPTVALVDGSRRVLAVWLGKLSTDKESELISKVKGVCPSCKGGA